MSDNKRIAKNTILLYIRMFFSMIIGLYTSRVVLSTLGVIDYGLYNVVAGVVVLFIFINSAMTNATQRYLTFELGMKDSGQLHKVFCISINLHIIIGILIILLCESIGLWFIYNKLVLPPDRLNAAIFVFQFSILSTFFSIICVPYNSMIIAQEKMDAYAYISIIEMVLKLLIVYLLLIIRYDKLIVYGLLMLMIQIIMNALYCVYCQRKFVESRYKFQWDNKLFKEMFKFASWNLMGNGAVVAYTEGVNMLLNVFFGPAVNAARGIAITINSVVSKFSRNFQVAINPQITKSYASKNFSNMYNLLYASSRFSFFLLLIICVPIIIETESILKIWLKIVPNYSIIFTRIILCICIINTLVDPLDQAALATGNIKRFQLIICGILLSILPISYFVLELNCAPWSVFIVHFIVFLIAYILRVYIVHKMVGFTINDYMNNTILPCVKVLVLVIPIPLALSFLLPKSILNCFIICLISIISSCLVVYFVGLLTNEKTFVLKKIKNVWQRNS